MLMSKKDRLAIYEHLFNQGVMVAKKDFHAPKHPELEQVSNLHVIKALTSLKSRGYVKEQFAWRHYYWYLTNEGIGYLRNFLHLPPEIVPATLKRQSRPEARPRPSAGPGRGFGDKPAEGDRAAYRRAPGTNGDKAGAAGPGSAPMEFVSLEPISSKKKQLLVLMREISELLKNYACIYWTLHPFLIENEVNSRMLQKMEST